MKKVLVLGGSGMLGRMVIGRLSQSQSLHVASTTRMASAKDTARSPVYSLRVGDPLAPQIERILSDFPADYIVNCIGIINVDCRDHDSPGVLEAVRVNAEFPHALNEILSQQNLTTKVIHITTDCVFSGSCGNYDENSLADPSDFYGKSKLLGEVQAPRWLNVRCSIIGPNPTERRGLLEWVRSHPPGATVPGFEHHRWNGVTTLQFATLCEDLITTNRFDTWRELNHTLHYAPNHTVTKYELIGMINKVFECGLEVKPVSKPGPAIDRTLASNYLTFAGQPMVNALCELKQFAG